MSVNPIQLAYLPRGDENALLDWLAYHADWHHRVAQKAIQDGHNDLGVYRFSTMADKDDWTYFHNADHENISSTYKLAGPPDLSYWDFEDDVNFSNWLFAHALVHQDIQKGLKL